MVEGDYCFCGKPIIWRKYMKYGIKQECPVCGAWWKWDLTGLHVTKLIKTEDGKFTCHAVTPNHMLKA